VSRKEGKEVYYRPDQAKILTTLEALDALLFPDQRFDLLMNNYMFDLLPEKIFLLYWQNSNACLNQVGAW
jgi:hypothetical protein